MPDERRARYLDASGLPALTPSAIHDRAELGEHLSRLQRSQGALEIEEFQLGVVCMAAPVHDPTGDLVSSVAISPTTAEFRSRRWVLERTVRQDGVRITRSLACAARSGR